MELRQLQYFIAVAEELNFSRAAERVKITQPPLSLQIQNLEKELDIVLFYRNKRQVKLTDAGKLFYTEVCKIFNHLERAVEDAKRTQHGEIGTIRVGFVGSATYDILPSILREFRNLYSEVEVHLFEMSTPMQLEALREGEIDIGVLRPPVNDEIVHTEIVSTVPCVLAVPKQHPLLKIKNVSLSDLKTYPFVMLSRKTWSNLYDEILGLCNPIIQQEALEFQTVIGLVAAKLGIAVVPQSAVNLHTQDVVYLDLDDQLPVASMGIAWRQKDQSPLVQSFIQLARETCLF
ncbi:LysR family transcriptional regulator [Priestia megaterium]|uniref:Bacterial regulatory helix-turn-helix, lysR family protein n=1 Tax=Priestia megaterium (strain ATCC 14581 / DSM 32 / CCUG 1817 / JCM 2506 / NBRC 15308 / NCIMB 9376 / NCTC 10342 / NRRL B-14308 / VKM B-512 / Ford 19) TaxID=1348623 RepID=A0A0B6AKE0_PRIM2|nr:LysR family transcriptional regulator [Priestia megaterium]AJI20279.1 bacterial regulatory helix-turn-helix, lysR family protein [Priestia megaterium NBRC 15308 = ATCC 14581]KGJ81376.1 LysR family transcriptional regulator [Priestia megaterium NBRC 15308 = ATCC 14581]MCE4090753.1 LysR family transcriptional regulator [Priestia megaterium]MDH3160452.1 LysR family transcriptional regulator [Priestia megaterium]MED3808070.1 LysR family transcriptional regulator [Priestia megaterium]